MQTIGFAEINSTCHELQKHLELKSTNHVLIIITKGNQQGEKK